MGQKTISQKIFHFPLVKILIGFTVCGGLAGSAQVALGFLSKGSTLNSEVVTLVIGIIVAFLSVVSYILLFRFYEKRNISEFSKKGITRNLTLGILLGMGLQALTILIIYLFNGYSIISLNPILYAIPPFTMAITSAVFEETLFRGIIFRITEEKLGSYLALLISALIFGAIHLANPNSSFIAGAGLVIQAGLLLGAAYIYTKSLWFPIAIHFAWNFTQSAVFGAKVSGIEVSKTLLTSKIEGADWFTGGQFGPEGSVQATVFCFIAAFVLIILSHKEGKIVKPYWKE